MSINDYWKEGKYVDLWSIPHILSGIVLGAILFSLGVSFVPSLVISLVLFVGWEAVEVFVGIKEHITNMTMDVVCDLLGFFITSYFYFILLKPFSLITILIFVGLFVIFDLWGFTAYEKRHRLE